MSRVPVIELTEKRKTLVAAYPSPTQGLIISRFLAVLGEVELAWAGEHNPEVVFLLFPH